MAKRTPRSERATVREPIQVYLTSEERSALDRLAGELGVSRAEILRRGLRSYAVEQARGQSPLLDLVRDLRGDDWPPGTAERHDELLADTYREEGD